MTVFPAYRHKSEVKSFTFHFSACPANPQSATTSPRLSATALRPLNRVRTRLCPFSLSRWRRRREPSGWCKSGRISRSLCRTSPITDTGWGIVFSSILGLTVMHQLFWKHRELLCNILLNDLAQGLAALTRGKAALKNSDECQWRSILNHLKHLKLRNDYAFCLSLYRLEDLESQWLNIFSSNEELKDIVSSNAAEFNASIAVMRQEIRDIKVKMLKKQVNLIIGSSAYNGNICG